ncbi:MAG: sodium:solute symporter family transporter, partial [Armatimonadota bacterium]
LDMVVFLVNLKGGFGAAVSSLCTPEAAPAFLVGPGKPQPMFPPWLTLLSLVVLTSFGPWGLPQMVQKFYSIKSEADIRRAMIVASAFSFFIAFGAYFTGALTHLFYSGDVKAVLAAKYHLPPGKDALDYLMPDFLTTMVPPWVSMIILLLVFSASMSSLSSLVLVSSSAIAVDLYAGLKRDAKERTVNALMRVLCGVFIGVSLYIAFNRFDFIVNLMSISWGVLAGAFLAPYCYGLFWKRTTKAGAVAGMLCGIITMILFVETNKAPGNPAIPVGGALAMAVPVVVVPLVSLVTKPFDKKHLNKVFGEEPGERAAQ